MLKDLNYYYIFSKLRVGLVGQAFTFQRTKQKKLERMIEFQFPITKEYNHSVWWSNNPFREEKKVFWSALSLFCVWSKYKKQSWNNLPTPSNKHQLDIKHLEKSWDFFGQSVLKWWWCVREKTLEADRTGQSVQNLQSVTTKSLRKRVGWIDDRLCVGTL